jgi:hypothetical protein
MGDGVDGGRKAKEIVTVNYMATKNIKYPTSYTKTYGLLSHTFVTHSLSSIQLPN